MRNTKIIRVSESTLTLQEAGIGFDELVRWDIANADTTHFEDLCCEVRKLLFRNSKIFARKMEIRAVAHGPFCRLVNRGFGAIN